jgi:hypothetical protein
MKLLDIVGSACLGLVFLATAKADTLAAFSTSVTSADSTQLGRNSRSGVPQDWSGTESYTGIVNTTTTYFYKTFAFNASLFAGGGYLDISTFEPLNTSVYFLTAYSGSYNPSNPGMNWLGDTGFSGNYQTNDGGDFQVILPGNQNLVLLLNTTGGGTAGLNTPISIRVDNYSDSMYSDPVAVGVAPEPSTFVMIGTGLLSVGGIIRRRRLASL